MRTLRWLLNCWLLNCWNYRRCPEWSPKGFWRCQRTEDHPGLCYNREDPEGVRWKRW